jgi:hypothetical protein
MDNTVNLFFILAKTAGRAGRLSLRAKALHPLQAFSVLLTM